MVGKPAKNREVTITVDEWQFAIDQAQRESRPPGSKTAPQFAKAAKIGLVAARNVLASMVAAGTMTKHEVVGRGGKVTVYLPRR